MWIRYLRNLKSKYQQQCKEELHSLKYWTGGKLSTVILLWLEKEMATHSSTLAWRIPWTEEPGGLQSMESQNQTQLSDWHKHTLLWYPPAWPNVAGNLGITPSEDPGRHLLVLAPETGKGTHLAQRKCRNPPFCSFSLSSFTPVYQHSCGGGKREDSSCGSIGTHTILREGKLSSVPWSCSFRVRAKPFHFFPIFLSPPITWPQMQHNQGNSGCFPSRRPKREAPKKMRPQTGSSLGKWPCKIAYDLLSSPLTYRCVDLILTFIPKPLKTELVGRPESKSQTDFWGMDCGTGPKRYCRG